tara:strand:- start:494 stop:1105 length:612 start_codon:yes stop_codon:yes gene_type:complete
MEIVKSDKIGIKKSVMILKRGGVIVYPTDTAYGLGGIYNSKQVISKILKIKRRKDKKFTIIAASTSQVQKYFKLNSIEKKLAKKYWPGPLSIVISDDYAVRVPKNDVARSLARRVGKPLIATSANISGKATLYDNQKIIKQFTNKKNPRLDSIASRRSGRQAWQEPDLILDAGKLKKNKTSTIVKVLDQEIKIIRSGSISIKN